MPTDYRFTGQRAEQPLGIYIMGARWYDPALGRWLSADTLVPEPGEPQGFNRYSFVLGNPLHYRDPSGHYSSDVHQVLTQKWTCVSVLQLARTYGMGIEEANALATDLPEKVANADQGVDCATCPDSSARKSGVLHWMNHKEANANMAEVVQSGDPEAFGQALHAVQE